MMFLCMFGTPQCLSLSESYLNLSGPAYHPGAERDMGQVPSHTVNVLQWVERVETGYHHGTCVSGYSQPRQHYHYSHYHCRVHHIFIYHPATCASPMIWQRMLSRICKLCPPRTLRIGLVPEYVVHFPSCHTKSSTQSACAASGTEWR